MSTCYVCEDNLTLQNISDEHILLNALGCPYKSKSILCEGCNSDFGETIDINIIKKLNPFMVLLDVKRPRGDVQPIQVESSEEDGEFYLYPDGSTLKKTEWIDNGDTMTLVMQGKGKENVKESARNILKKHGRSAQNIEGIMREAKHEKTQVGKEFSFSSSLDENDFPAICKMALNFYMDKRGDRKHIKHLIPYIKLLEKQEVVKFFLNDELTTDIKEVSHFLYLKGDNEEKILYCYVELFSSFGFLVKLSENYDGNSIEESYAFDLLERNVFKKNWTKKISKDDLIEILSSDNRKYNEMVCERIKRIMTMFNQRQMNK